jgi:DnaJ-class molecular chaperone
VSSENHRRLGRLPSMAVCPDCRGRGWTLVGATAVSEPDKLRCERCEGTGYVGLRESIAEAGGVS